MCQKLNIDIKDTDIDTLKTKIIKEMGQQTFCTATDGNHGRGVAWAAKKLGQKAIIYMPKGTVEARVKHIQD
jgi:diaminopropionate ammonia-lyase